MLYSMGLAAMVMLLAFTVSNPVELSWITIAPEGKGFVSAQTRQPYIPWGFNYDHDARGRLLEDYWDAEWYKVEQDFRDMKRLGANIVRIHLQFNKFVTSSTATHEQNLDRLGKLVGLAEKVGIYLDVTGLGCYHKAEVPAWYDQLTEAERWKAQALFWKAVAYRCASSPSIFCYNLMNEPVVSGGRRQAGEWLGPPFAGKHFVQFVTLDQDRRSRPEIARQWIRTLVAAIREKDTRHLITVGLVDWSLDRPGLTSGFVPSVIAQDLDFISVHLYPVTGKLQQALETLQGFSVGKPIVIEETFPLRCSARELELFIEASRKHSSGWIGFYWGKMPDELKRSSSLADKITLSWLDLFQKLSRQLNAPR